MQIGGDLAEERWLLAAENEGSVPRPFLATLVFWLTILFAGFGLFAPRHATVVVALLVCALSLSAAVFLILEMDRPFEGFVTVSPEPMRTALAHMGIRGAPPIAKRSGKVSAIQRSRRISFGNICTRRRGPCAPTR